MGVARYGWLILVLLALSVSTGRAEPYTRENSDEVRATAQGDSSTDVFRAQYDNDLLTARNAHMLSFVKNSRGPDMPKDYGVLFDVRPTYSFTLRVPALSSSPVSIDRAEAYLSAQLFLDRSSGQHPNVWNSHARPPHIARRAPGKTENSRLRRQPTAKTALLQEPIQSPGPSSFTLVSTGYSGLHAGTYQETSTVATPEPGTSFLALTACGACVLFLWRRRRKCDPTW